MKRFTKFALVVFVLSAALYVSHKVYEKLGVDSNYPVISFDDDVITLSVSDPESVLLSDVTAIDEEDGDISNKVVVEAVSNLIGSDRRIITYAVADKAYHVSRKERTLIYSDYESPSFAITEPLVFKADSSSILDGVSANDCIDGDISNNIRVVSGGSFSLSRPGEYEVSLQVANSIGDMATLPVRVRITDGTENQTPQVVLSDYLLYIDKGDRFDPYSFIDSVKINNRSYKVTGGSGNYGDRDAEKVYIGRDQIEIKNMPDTDEVGCYEVRYILTIDDGEGEPLVGTTYQYVVVREGKETGES